MALEDTREFGQRPKVDAYEDFVLVVFYTARESEDRERVIDAVEVHVYVPATGSSPSTASRSRCSTPPRRARAGTPTHEEDHLVYRIFDALTDAFYPAIDALEERIDELEAAVLERPREELLRRVYRRKQEVHELQRLVATQRDQFQTASGAIMTSPASAAARASTCATSATTWPRSAASCSARTTT